MCSQCGDNVIHHVSMKKKKKNVQKQAPFLQALPLMNKKQLKAVIKEASPHQIHSICEICYNLLKSNIPLTDTELKKMKKFKKIIRKLAVKGESVKKKKRVINQTGGVAFLGILAPLLASLAASFYAKHITRKAAQA